MKCITETSEALGILEGVQATLLLLAESDLYLDPEDLSKALYNQGQLIKESVEMIRIEQDQQLADQKK